jgi:hypothetical protein
MPLGAAALAAGGDVPGLFRYVGLLDSGVADLDVPRLERGYSNSSARRTA